MATPATEYRIRWSRFDNSTGSAAGTVEAIDACMRANIPPALQIRQFSLNAVDHNGAGRLMKGRLYAIRDNGLLRTMLRIDSPPDLRGAAYLLREGEAAQQDAMYVYLPALNKVRRIMGGTQDNPLFGTDLSYADLKQISHAFSGGRIELEKTDKIDGRDIWPLIAGDELLGSVGDEVHDGERIELEVVGEARAFGDRDPLLVHGGDQLGETRKNSGAVGHEPAPSRVRASCPGSHSRWPPGAGRVGATAAR